MNSKPKRDTRNLPNPVPMPQQYSSSVDTPTKASFDSLERKESLVSPSSNFDDKSFLLEENEELLLNRFASLPVQKIQFGGNKDRIDREKRIEKYFLRKIQKWKKINRSPRKIQSKVQIEDSKIKFFCRICEEGVPAAREKVFFLSHIFQASYNLMREKDGSD